MSPGDSRSRAGPGRRPSGAWLLGLFACAACSAPRPAEEPAEREALERAGTPFATRFAERPLPELPVDASRTEVLRYGFLSNAGLEQACFEWRAALERVPQAVSLPDPSLSFDFLSSARSRSKSPSTSSSGTASSASAARAA